MNSSKRGCVYGFKLQSLDLVSVAYLHLHIFFEVLTLSSIVSSSE